MMAFCNSETSHPDPQKRLRVHRAGRGAAPPMGGFRIGWTEQAHPHRWVLPRQTVRGCVGITERAVGWDALPVNHRSPVLKPPFSLLPPPPNTCTIPAGGGLKSQPLRDAYTATERAPTANTTNLLPDSKLRDCDSTSRS